MGGWGLSGRDGLVRGVDGGWISRKGTDSGVGWGGVVGLFFGMRGKSGGRGGLGTWELLSLSSTVRSIFMLPLLTGAWFC